MEAIESDPFDYAEQPEIRKSHGFNTDYDLFQEENMRPMSLVEKSHILSYRKSNIVNLKVRAIKDKIERTELN